MTKQGIKSSPLRDLLAAGEFILQAIANLPVEHFAASRSELVAGDDDLDHYIGVGIETMDDLFHEALRDIYF